MLRSKRSLRAACAEPWTRAIARASGPRARGTRGTSSAHRLGHSLSGENDRRISLLDRLIQHCAATARYGVFYGDGRDAYDERSWPRALRAVLAQVPRKSGTPRFLIVQEGRIVSNQLGASAWAVTLADLKQYLE